MNIYFDIFFIIRERERERVNINSREILFTWNTSMAQAHLVQKESNPHGNFLIYSILFSLDKNWTPSLSIQCDFNWWNVIIIRFSISFKEVVITLKKSWYLVNVYWCQVKKKNPIVIWKKLKYNCSLGSFLKMQSYNFFSYKMKVHF